MEIILLILFVILIAGCFSKDEATKTSSQQQLGKNLAKLITRLFR